MCKLNVQYVVALVTLPGLSNAGSLAGSLFQHSWTLILCVIVWTQWKIPPGIRLLVSILSFEPYHKHGLQYAAPFAYKNYHLRLHLHGTFSADTGMPAFDGNGCGCHTRAPKPISVSCVCRGAVARTAVSWLNRLCFFALMFLQATWTWTRLPWRESGRFTTAKTSLCR